MLSSSDVANTKYKTLTEMLRTAAAAHEQGLIFVGLDERESFHPWSEIFARAKRAAATFAAHGVSPGDRVAIVLPTSLGFMDAFFGALLAGAVPVPLYPPVRLGRLEEYHQSTVRMVRTARARLLVLDARVKPVLGQVVEQAGVPYLEAERLTAGSAELERETAADALALIQFSSGSTVAPKAVALTHGQLLSQCASLEIMLRRVPGNTQVGASWLPLYHDMGLIGCLLSAAYYPGRLVLIAPEHFLAKPAIWLRAIARHRAFISPAPNFAYALCAKRVRDQDLVGLDLSCWKLALNGAEPVLAQTLDAFSERFERFGFDRASLLPVYGLSEAALAVTFGKPGRKALRRADGLVSVGVPVPGFSVRVVDAQGNDVQDGTEGRVWAKGPSVMLGYFDGDPVGEWLDTGDLGLVEQGELFITGRAKDIVIIRGANHMPQSFEAPLHDIAGLRVGCAVAVGERFAEAGGEALLVLAERASDNTRSDQDISADINERLLATTGIRPQRVVLLTPGTLPRTSSGKLRRAEALTRYRAGTLSPPQRVNVVSMSRAMVGSTVSYLRAWMRR
jgi:fatty-acyl-CoA synthase